MSLTGDEREACRTEFFEALERLGNVTAAAREVGHRPLRLTHTTRTHGPLVAMTSGLSTPRRPTWSAGRST